ncbi:MAG: UDP-N-acetylmuramoyl-L-alanine--D-glutamate ligase [Clostridia bacterium]|nr:UDP-N-acetylmuramoyl-L-alanine--D-glutamate ligase [Clostridia bacterium]
MYIKTQTFLVLGISRSGLSAAKYLLGNGAKALFFYEEAAGEKIEKAKEEIISSGGKETGKDDVEETLGVTDVLVISPGVAINHPIAVMARNKGVKIMGELELAYRSFIPPIIAVTGTNGKTTTVTVINDLLKAAGYSSQAVGNIGIPFTEKIGSGKDTVFVTEVSSFQLESVSSFTPHVSCVLNISPDHLERHYSMENYVFLKKRIFMNQRESEYAILNFDDPTVRGFFTEVKAKVSWVSVKEKVDGAYFSDGYLCYGEEKVISADDLPIGGEHNVYDMLFSIAAAKLMGVKTSDIAETLKNFKGVPFRMQTVAVKDGVTYVNDSKSTNTASAINAIKSVKGEKILILGGSEKGETYDKLFGTVKENAVKRVVLTGKSARNMLYSADKAGVDDVTVVPDFDTAIKVAKLLAQDGDTVLFSPACASFDRFSGFVERGNRFNEIVGVSP